MKLVYGEEKTLHINQYSILFLMQTNIPDIEFNHSRSINGFEVMKISELSKKEKVLENKLHTPHRLKFYQILYVLDGEGTHTVDFHLISLAKGKLVFVAPNQVHAFEEYRTYEGYICLFTEDFLIRESLQLMDRYIIDNLYFKDITKALVLEDSSMEAFFYLLQKEFFKMNSTGKAGVVTSLLRSILIKSSDQLQTNISDNESSALFNSFKKALMKRYSDIHYAEDYASLLKVSPKHLNITCKKMTTLTTKAFIDKFMIIEAKRYLTSSTAPIKDIATKMGYLEVNNFSKFFKKHTGQTPKTFRDLQLLM